MVSVPTAGATCASPISFEIKRLISLKIATASAKSETGARGALDAKALRRDEIALVIPAKIARSGRVLGTRDGIFHVEESVARDTKVRFPSGAGKRTLAEIGIHSGQHHAGADAD